MKIRLFALGLLFTMLFTTTVFAQNDIKLTINNKVIAFDVPPQIVDGRTLVPMRKIFEELNSEVEWLEQSQTIYAFHDSKLIIMQIGKNSMYIADLLTGINKEIQIDVPPQIINGRTLVPVRAVSESLNMNVGWDDSTKTVIITSYVDQH